MRPRNAVVIRTNLPVDRRDSWVAEAKRSGSSVRRNRDLLKDKFFYGPGGLRLEDCWWRSQEEIDRALEYARGRLARRQ
jgi:hypothetical protein